MKRTTVIRGVAAAAIAVGIAIPASSAFGSGTLSGAGSTLVQPLVQKVFAPDFQSSSGNSVQYAGVGSGAGIAQITARSVNFGASDAPMTPTQMSSCGCVEIPWALSATRSRISHLRRQDAQPLRLRARRHLPRADH